MHGIFKPEHASAFDSELVQGGKIAKIVLDLAVKNPKQLKAMLVAAFTQRLQLLSQSQPPPAKRMRKEEGEGVKADIWIPAIEDQARMMAAVASSCLSRAGTKFERVKQAAEKFNIGQLFDVWLETNGVQPFPGVKQGAAAPMDADAPAGDVPMDATDTAAEHAAAADPFTAMLPNPIHDPEAALGTHTAAEVFSRIVKYKAFGSESLRESVQSKLKAGRKFTGGERKTIKNALVRGLVVYGRVKPGKAPGKKRKPRTKPNKPRTKPNAEYNGGKPRKMSKGGKPRKIRKLEFAQPKSKGGVADAGGNPSNWCYDDMRYACERCWKGFKTTNNAQTHLKKKKPCTQKEKPS